MKGERKLRALESKRKKIGIYGHFGSSNFGNEVTLQTILYHLRRLLHQSETICICTYPDVLAASQNIETVPISRTIVRQWYCRNPMAKLLRKVFIGIPSEVYRWIDAYKTLKGSDMFVIPGTGLLTDAFGLRQWGPYNLFKWTSMAKLRRCKVLFVSVGAGPIYGMLGKHFIKSALSLADFRSYRDDASMKYLKKIGFPTNSDRVYPDLVFSLPQAMIPNRGTKQGKRRVVGLGLMEYAGKYSVEKPSNSVYLAYLEGLVLFVKWLLGHEYDIRLLVGDCYDLPVTKEFKSLLTTRLGAYDEKRVIDEPAFSVEELLPQIAATDIVVATRFHNILLALLLGKPVIGISFHHKCASLMSEMGLSEYCHDINHMNADTLIEQFQDVERNAEKVKTVIRQKVEQSRKALDEQYSLILKCV
jgi:polysaccharide pyruvyl transferase WcaK-like protein